VSATWLLCIMQNLSQFLCVCILVVCVCVCGAY
jgi:hypothetical protein